MSQHDEANRAADIDSVDWIVDDARAVRVGEPGSGPRRTRCKTKTLRELISPILEQIERGEKPIVWTPADEPWGNLVFRPRSLLTIGGPHNGGKTALVVDVVGKLLGRYPELRVVFASNDMDTERKAERFLANVAGWNYSEIQERVIEGGDAHATEAVKAALEPIDRRLTVVLRPFTMLDLADAARENDADIVVLDTLQPTDLGGEYHDSQQRHVAAVMRSLRALADTGPCVVATSPLSRSGVAASRERVGKTDVTPLDMGYFAHAHEIEAESDLLLLLLAEKGEQLAAGPEVPRKPIKMWLQCVKARDGVKTILPLWFDGSTQRFSLREFGSEDGRASAQVGGRKPAAGKDGSSAGTRSSGQRDPKKETKQHGTHWLD
jgi:hypothetical protein